MKPIKPCAPNRLFARATLALSTLLASASLLVADSATQPLPPLRERIETAFKDVDRLIVTPPIEDSRSLELHKEILFDLRGTDRIAPLAKTIVLIEPNDDEWLSPCLCFGTHEIMLYRGEKLVFRLNYKHFSKLKGIGESSPFQGEFDLTEESAVAFADWFAEKGFSDFQKASGEQREALRLKQERTRQVIATFPENVRTIIPENSPTDKPWTRTEERKKQVAEAMAHAKNKTEILHACWRAIGGEYHGHGYNRDRILGVEPVATIFALIEAVSDADRNNALQNVSPDESTLLYGAFVSLRGADKHMAEKYSDSVLAKIFASVWQHQPEKAEESLASEMKHAEGRECLALRLKIASSGQPSPRPYEPPSVKVELGTNLTILSVPAIPLWLEALLDLSMQRVPEARKIVLEKLKDAPEGFDKLALEIALACYDGTAKLQEKHFLIEESQIEQALDMLQPNRRKPVK